MKEWLSIADCAELSGASRWAIWHAARLGRLASYRVGSRPGSGHYRIRRSDFEAYIAASVVHAGPRRIAECAADVLLIDRFARSAAR